jgi:LPXTG cell wall anchor motif
LKKVLYLATAALVAMLILVPSAMAQTEVTMEKEVQMEGTQPLPKSGGVGVGSASILLPAAALLVGAGVLGVAVLRRR